MKLVNITEFLIEKPKINTSPISNLIQYLYYFNVYRLAKVYTTRLQPGV